MAPRRFENIHPALRPLAMPIAKLRLLDGNPNVGDVEAVARSLERFTQRKPITAQPDGVVTAGNTTMQAAQSLGWTHIAVVPTDDDAVTAMAWALADNHSDLGTTDDLLLRDMLLEVQALDPSLLEAASYTEEDVADLIARIAEEAAAGDVPLRTDADHVPDSAPAVTVLGDVWKLGDHLLVCGDSTSPTVIDRLMGDERAAMVWTDPPYNVAIDGKAGTILNDDLSEFDFGALLNGAMQSAFTLLRPGGSIYVAHADTERLAFTAAFKDAGFHLSGCLIWRKQSLVLGRSDYQWQHEPILYGWKPGAAHRWFGGRKQTTVIESTDSPFLRLDDTSWQLTVGDRIVVVSGTDLTFAEYDGTVIEVDRPSRSADHPTMKPVELIARHVRNSSRAGDVVVDLFGGSGSTLIAAHVTNRVARLVELDPKFCDVICRRWQEATGIVPVNARTRRRRSFVTED